MQISQLNEIHAADLFTHKIVNCRNVLSQFNSDNEFGFFMALYWQQHCINTNM